MNVSKRSLTLLIVATMVIGLMPSVMMANAVLGAITYDANGVPGLPATSVKGDKIKVFGAGPVAAGTLVEIYWDDTIKTTWDSATASGKLNSTAASGTGAWEVWFKVPSCVYGVHTLWIKEVSSGTTATATFNIRPKISPDPTTGVVGDTITLSYYGYSKSKEIAFFLHTGAALGAGTAVAWANTGQVGDGATKTFSGTLANLPVVPGSVGVRDFATVETFVDGGNGVLTGVGATGTINYVTGKWEVTFAVAPLALATIQTMYSYYTATGTAVNDYKGTGATDAIGYWTSTFTVPAVADGGYFVVAYDGKGISANVAWTKGQVISLSASSGNTGDVIRVNGKGWNPARTITKIEFSRAGGLALTTADLYYPAAWGFAINPDGTWYADVVVPQGDTAGKEYTITATDSGASTATKKYTINTLAKVVASPNWGPQGSDITVTGTDYDNFKDKVITVDLETTAGVFVATLGTVKTDNVGGWSKVFTVPAVASGNYKIRAYNTGSKISAKNDFKVGSVAVVVNPTSADTGRLITVTGSGFTASEKYGLKFGDKVIVDETSGVVAADGTIVKAFDVPQVAAGVYTISVKDVKTGVEITASFTVKRTTTVTISPSSAPNTYITSFEGIGFKPSQAVTYTLYNKTSTGSWARFWPITVVTNTNSTGGFKGPWTVLASATLSNGQYYIDIVDAAGYKVTVPFTVSAVYIKAEPRKAAFKPSEILSFVLEHSLGNVAPILNSYLKVYNPSGTLVYQTDGTFNWVKVTDYYVATYSSQVSSGNQMVFADDAPIGTWTWKWTDTNAKLVKEGSFKLEASTASVTDAKIDALSKQITDMKTASDAAKAAADAAKTAAASAQTTAQSAVTAATDAKTAATDAKTAATAVGTKADAATAAANAAKAAADAAKAAADSLTTMVYVAIAASVVAALAAIFAVMQITKKIA
jgi:hypothetical protein